MVAAPATMVVVDDLQDADAPLRIVDTGHRIEVHPTSTDDAVPGDAIAYADYHLDGDVLVVPYVETHPRHRGHGLGAVAVCAVAAYAIERGLRIRPLCGFAAGELRARPDAGDLLERR